jgi:PAS domain S-box-containing protein
MGNMGKSESLSRGNGKNTEKSTNLSIHFMNIAVTIGIFLILIILWFQVCHWYEQDLYSELRLEETKTLILQADSLSMSIKERISLLEGLSSFTQVHNNCDSIEKHFSDYIRGFYSTSGGIRNFAVAPGGVQTYIYPGSEAGSMIGHDLINDSRENVRNDVNLTIVSGDVILSGPYELRQGGFGLVARKATYVDGEFFALTTMVIDMPYIFQDVGINVNSSNIALRTDNQTIIGNPDVFRQYPVLQTIYLYNKQWELARIPAGGWEASIAEQVTLFKLITILPVLLLTIMSYFVLNRQRDLETSVAQQTSELRMEKELTQKYLDDSGVMFFILDVDGNISLVNKKVEELLGYTRLDILGSNWLETLIPKNDRQHIREICDSMLGSKSDDSRYCESATLTKNGDLKLVMWHASAIKNEFGEITGMLAAGKDITERKETENALKNFAEELSIKNEELKSLDLLKNEFISNISHELRTPMNSIKGFAELMYYENMGKLSTEQKNALSKIINSSQDLEKLIDSLLYVASSRKGGIKCSLVSLDLRKLLSEITNNVSHDAESKGIRLSLYIDSSLPMIKGDEEYLAKVFWNLLNNAIKFTTSGGNIILSASLIGDKVHISVEDTGIGIPHEQLESVFDDFYQVDGSPTRKYSGTGIGLFISKKIVISHGGDIWLESTKDVGTTVHVILPVYEQKTGI